jgi:hypothetical protein
MRGLARDALRPRYSAALRTDRTYGTYRTNMTGADAPF